MPLTTSLLIMSLAAGSAFASVIPASIEDTLLIPRQQGKSHVVVVGSTTNPKATTFTPNNIQAAAGDTVKFQFVSGAHSATQAAGPQSACQPAAGGFNSGFMPVTQGQGAKTFTTTVKDAGQPMYVYCAAANHCQLGMVMTINGAGGDNNAFKSAAKNAKSNVAAKGVSGGTVGGAAGGAAGKAGAGGAAGGAAGKAAGGAGGGAGGLLAALGGGKGAGGGAKGAGKAKAGN